MYENVSVKRWWLGSVLISIALFLGLFGLSLGAQHDEASNEDHEEYEHDERNSKYYFSPAIPKLDKVYLEECGSCHFAYPPGLLPQQSWYVIMTELEQHFGENAELDGETRSHLIQYLGIQSVRKDKPRSMNKLLRLLPEEAPKRITNLPYFIHEHDEIPDRMVKDNPEVKTFSQCDACHKNADKGDFDEDRVFIPGFGSWRD